MCDSLGEGGNVSIFTGLKVRGEVFQDETALHRDSARADVPDRQTEKNKVGQKNKTTLAAKTERAVQNIAASAAPPNPVRGSVQTDPRTSFFLAIYWQ